MTPFLVSKFDKATISNLIKECFGSEFPDVISKDQVDYLSRYLKDLGADSALLESEYVDKDYLDDHSKFYVRRFGNRGHTCARLHFFSGKWEHVHFDQLLSQGGPPDLLEKLRREYLGFVVVKPLPKTFIGKTCLKLYPNNVSITPDRHCLRRRYTAQLFGIPLQVESVAFQEQDKVISACATTSIWSALHALEWLNVRDISSCCEITTNALNFIPDSTNSFPSNELTQKQILRAIDCQGLRHHSYAIRQTDPVTEEYSKESILRIIQCHIRSSLPLVLRVVVYTIKKGEIVEARAGHEVTILGYHTSGETECLYVHDDRLGPFARATFVSLQDFPICDGANVQPMKGWALKVQQKDDFKNWKPEHELLVPSTLTAMTDKKVRLPLKLVLNTCDYIRRLYDQGRSSLSDGPDKDKLPLEIKFDVELIETSKFKAELLEHEAKQRQGAGASQAETLQLTIAERKMIQFVTRGFARFQWIARFRSGDSPIFDLLFDATDVPQGDAVSAIYIRNEEITDLFDAAIDLSGAFRRPEIANVPETFVASYLRRIKPKRKALDDHLDKFYGEPRAPRELRLSEVVGIQQMHLQTTTFYEAVDLPLAEVFKDLEVDNDWSCMLWLIDLEGALVIGKEEGDLGHPAMINYRPARIAGELRRTSTGWIINPDSGRYSRHYHNSDELVENAVRRFKAIFFRSYDAIRSDPDWRAKAEARAQEKARKLAAATTDELKAGENPGAS